MRFNSTQQFFQRPLSSYKVPNSSKKPRRVLRKTESEAQLELPPSGYGQAVECSNYSQISVLPGYKSYSQTSVDNYLTQRHLEAEMKKEKIKKEILQKERAECSGRPKINPNSIRMAHRLRSSSVKRILKKDNIQFLENQKKRMEEEAGISFAPKILKRSQSLQRSVGDLLTWDQHKSAKHRQIQQLQNEKTDRKESAMCPGSRALMENLGYHHRLEDLHQQRRQGQEQPSSRRQRIAELENLALKKKQTVKITKMGQKAESVVKSFIKGTGGGVSQEESSQLYNNTTGFLQDLQLARKPPLPGKKQKTNTGKPALQIDVCSGISSPKGPLSASSARSSRENSFSQGLLIHNISRISQKYQNEPQRSTPKPKKVVSPNVTNSAPNLRAFEIPDRFRKNTSCHRNCIPQIYHSNQIQQTQNDQKEQSLQERARVVRERLNNYYREKQDNAPQGQYEFSGCKFEEVSCSARPPPPPPPLNDPETIPERISSEETEPIGSESKHREAEQQNLYTTETLYQRAEIQEEIKEVGSEAKNIESFQNSELSLPSSARVANITPSKMFEMPSAFARRSNESVSALSEAIAQSLEEQQLAKMRAMSPAVGMEVVSEENTTAGYSMNEDLFMEQMATFNQKMETLINRGPSPSSELEPPLPRYSVEGEDENSRYRLNEEEKAELLRRISMFQKNG